MIFAMLGALFEVFKDPGLLKHWDSGLTAAGALANTILLTNLVYLERWKHSERAGSGAASLAARLAGRRRNMRPVWLADLAGDPDTGLVLTARQKRRLARGYVLAALRMRVHDMAAPAWRPVDWLLAAESRTRTATVLTVGAQIVYIQATDGLHMLLTEGWAWCGACALAVTGLFRWLRRLRGIELAASSTPEE
ncbi:hypothetical protein [Streptomyces luteogriseus]|uniref:hypothetical protein n=1 Tax=Streptomyces luteogriseus TaxID=68233 RepID=UPI0016193EDA|nr:hypothetical protein [Streptomyces luteogriseus]